MVRRRNSRPDLSGLSLAVIVARFVKLNPYTDKSRSILKIERDNYDAETGRQRLVYCLAIASKRYALFLRDEHGDPVLLQKGINNHEDRWSEHGLGHLRNPLNPDSDNRDWIPQAWISIIRRTLGLPSQPLGFEDVPAMGRVPITSPTAMRSLAKLNRGKKYRNRIKPFDFLLTCHVKQFGYPPDVDPGKFHLVAPYVPDPECWVDLPWIDQHSGTQYEITTEGFHGSRGVARVKTDGEVLREYEFHPGAKSADAKGKPSGKQSVGLLRRRHVRVERIVYIGKESNRLEEIEAGVIHSPDNVYTEYPDPRRDEWQTRILPVLSKIPVEALMRFSGRSRSMLVRAMAGQSATEKESGTSKVNPPQTWGDLVLSDAPGGTGSARYHLIHFDNYARSPTRRSIPWNLGSSRMRSNCGQTLRNTSNVSRVWQAFSRASIAAPCSPMPS